jgi:hypothetical protein
MSRMIGRGAAVAVLALVGGACSDAGPSNMAQVSFNLATQPAPAAVKGVAFADVGTPEGLTFSPAEPAELKIHYNHADHDFNDDGSVNQFDDQIKNQLANWRQETLNDPFAKLGSVNVEETEEINADIFGFTRYAIAY